MQPSAKALELFAVKEFWEALGETLCGACVQFCFLIFQKKFLDQGRAAGMMRAEGTSRQRS